MYQTIFLSGPYNFAYYNESILRGLFIFSLEILCQLSILDVNWTWKRLPSMLGMQSTILRYVFIYFSKDWIDPLGDSMALYHLVHEVQLFKWLTWHKLISLSYFTYYLFLSSYLLSVIALCEIFCIFLFSQRFAAVIMRIREPRTTALIFSSGKMVCTGAKRYKT